MQLFKQIYSCKNLIFGKSATYQRRWRRFNLIICIYSGTDKVIKGICSKCNSTIAVTKHLTKCQQCDTCLTFQCGKCKFESYSQKTVRIHEKKHVEYCCQHLGCTKRFVHSRNLERHMKICKSAPGSERKFGFINLSIAIDEYKPIPYLTVFFLISQINISTYEVAAEYRRIVLVGMY